VRHSKSTIILPPTVVLKKTARVVGSLRSSSGTSLPSQWAPQRAQTIGTLQWFNASEPHWPQHGRQSALIG
jgi:hypothetical protein